MKTRRVGEHQSKLLIARWLKGELGAVPDQLPREFVVDCMAYQRMFVDFGEVHGRELQEEMAHKYPAPWMLWLMHEVGVFTYPCNYR